MIDTPVQSGSRWIARVMMAVILAEGIWGLLVSLTQNLIVPFLARQMGADPQSPLSLGKGNYDFPALFVSVLEFCLAGIVAVILNAWANKGVTPPKIKTVTVRKVVAPAPSTNLSINPGPVKTAAVSPIATPPVSATPAAATAVPAPAPVLQATVAAQPSPAVPAQAKIAPTPPPKPAKPKAPKEVYYNIVGEPINPTEEK